MSGLLQGFVGLHFRAVTASSGAEQCSGAGEAAGLKGDVAVINWLGKNKTDLKFS